MCAYVMMTTALGRVGAALKARRHVGSTHCSAHAIAAPFCRQARRWEPPAPGVSAHTGNSNPQVAGLLAHMELAGVALDPSALDSSAATISRRMEVLAERAAQLLGRPLNLASPQQLAAALYEQLALPLPASSGGFDAACLSCPSPCLLQSHKCMHVYQVSARTCIHRCAPRLPAHVRLAAAACATLPLPWRGVHTPPHPAAASAPAPQVHTPPRRTAPQMRPRCASSHTATRCPRWF